MTVSHAGPGGEPFWVGYAWLHAGVAAAAFVVAVVVVVDGKTQVASFACLQQLLLIWSQYSAGVKAGCWLRAWVLAHQLGH